VLEEAFHIVVVAQELKDQGLGSVFEDQSQLQAHSDFVPVITQFSQADAPVKMRLAQMSLGLAIRSPTAFQSAGDIARMTLSNSA
jgi:hypothetical protein